MGPSGSPEASQNCFMPTGADRKTISATGNEIYLYDEAEPLMYVCSDRSMPPRSAGSIRARQSADVSPTGRGSSSKTSRRKSRTSSTLVYESGGRQSEETVRYPRKYQGSTNDTKYVAADFKSQILNKLQEFDIRPNSSFSNAEECLESGGVGSNSGSRENKSQDIKELFIQNTKLFTSSSESEKVRISSEELQDEVFSTGISDMEEGVNHADIKQKSVKTTRSRETIDIVGLPQWFATKSIVKPADTRIKRPVAQSSPNRVGPPVQGKLSLRTMKATPPCFCLLEEIRKNNLVMKEDIISSSSHKGEFLTTRIQNVGESSSYHKGSLKDRTRRQSQSREREITNKLLNKQRTFGATGGNMNVTQIRMIDTESVEVYETTGDNVPDANVQKEEPNFSQDPVMPNVNALAANIRFEKNRFEEFWSPFNPPNLNNGSERSNVTEPTQKTISLNAVEKSGQMSEDSKPSASIDLQFNDNQYPRTNERHFIMQMNEYLEAKTSTPNRRPEKYFKLPGLAQAFFQQDSHFKDLRIKNGTSFESFNALKEISMRNMASKSQEHEGMRLNDTADQMKQSNNTNRSVTGKQAITQTKRQTETKDAATDFRIPLTNTKTQTGKWDKTLVDCSVQCESRIVDEANGWNVSKNDHKEIMVCNDNGDGVQLYNELGHPLTDMDGYLLKDSLGRFLVRLDRFGIPVSCTNGQAIFMEDSTAWDTVKNHMSILHQSRKKPIKRYNGVKKGKARPSLLQLDEAMKNLRNTLGLANKISLESSHKNILERLTYFDRGERSPRRRIKSTMDAAKLNNNTTSLIAEMKSIASLRNALLEKVNFIADNKNNLGKSGAKNKSQDGKKSPIQTGESYGKNWLEDTTSTWQGQNRPFSPTYQAVKKLKETASTSEAEWMKFSGGMTQDNTINKTYGLRGKARIDLWMDSVNGISLGDDLPKERKSEWNRLKTDSWVSALPDNSLNTNFPVVENADKNEVNTDLWSLMNDESHVKFNTETNSNENFPVSRTKGYQDLDRLDMLSVSKGTRNPGVSGFNAHPEDSGFTGSQLLTSLEKQYNLREGSTWIETWNMEESPVSSRAAGNSLYTTASEQARKRSEMMPSIEFSFSSIDHF